ncbi:MAG: Zn-dependent protease with chaperone function [Acidimicrobiales bacterium]|jgi:Zn-dependent protease with chaperone function
MDFQTHQEEAKQNTARLILLLAFGVASIIVVVSALLVALFYYSSGEFQPLAAIGVAAPVTTVAIVGTSLVKSAQIKGGGGSYVAASLGGRPVDFNTLDPAEKQLSNIVEEIAIASGMPVPAVFLLDEEPGINAFAAGWTADNAAIGVTRGALLHLNRRELQGVIAHEFSHIANGDTRVKTKIIGWVFGIAVITVLGRILLHSLWWAPRRRSKEDNSAMVMMVAAIALIVIGSVGTMFARMIQAAVSRQREFLADASAVQYTRDPSGIGEALIKIGAMGNENKIRSAHATEASHLFFSSAFGGGFASHPPLKSRIGKLIPSWDGQFGALDPVPAAASTGGANAQGGRNAAGPNDRWGGALPGHIAIPGMPNMGLPIDPAILLAGADGGAGTTGALTSSAGTSGAAVGDAPVSGVGGVGPEQRVGGPSYDGPSDAHIAYARSLLADIPEETQNYLHTRQGAVAAVIGSLVSTDRLLRPHQLDFAGKTISMDPDYLDAASKVISGLDRRLQLPAIDIALHSIRETPYEYKLSLAEAIRAMESSRPDQDLFRWILRRVMLRHLEDQHDDGSARHNAKITDLQSQATTVYAVLSWFNSSGPGQAQSAYEAALDAIGVQAHPVPALETLTFEVIDAALGDLSRLDRPGRQHFVEGAAALVLQDHRTTADEAELIRVVADAVRLPVPPLLID